MMKNIRITNLLNFLGLVAKSNNIHYGAKLWEQVRRNKISFVLLTTDIGASQLKKILELINKYKVKHYFICESALLSKAIGKDNIKAVGIQNQKMIEKIESLMQEI